MTSIDDGFENKPILERSRSLLDPRQGVRARPEPLPARWALLVRRRCSGKVQTDAPNCIFEGLGTNSLQRSRNIIVCNYVISHITEDMARLGLTDTGHQTRHWGAGEQWNSEPGRRIVEVVVTISSLAIGLTPS
jgi:hypothetical protein